MSNIGQFILPMAIDPEGNISFTKWQFRLHFISSANQTSSVSPQNKLSLSYLNVLLQLFLLLLFILGEETPEAFFFF